LVCFTAIAYIVLPVLFNSQPTNVHMASLGVKWRSLLGTLSGQAVARFVFGDAGAIIPYVPFWLIVTDCCLGLVCLFFAISDSAARENRKNGFFCLVISFLIFVQISITPPAGGPHHYSMIFPFPILTFAFFAKALNKEIASKSI